MLIPSTTFEVWLPTRACLAQSYSLLWYCSSYWQPESSVMHLHCLFLLSSYSNFGLLFYKFRLSLLGDGPNSSTILLTSLPFIFKNLSLNCYLLLPKASPSYFLSHSYYYLRIYCWLLQKISASSDRPLKLCFLATPLV